MATTTASLEQYLGHALACVNPKAGGLTPTELSSISQHSKYRAATYTGGTESIDFEVSYEAASINVQFEASTFNGKTVLSSHTSLATETDSYPIKISHLPRILAALEHQQVLHGKDVAMIQFPIALSLKSVLQLPIRQHFIHLALIKKSDGFDVYLIDSTGNPLGIGGLAAYVFSALTSISTLEVQFNALLNLPTVKNSLSKIFNFGDDKTLPDVNTTTVNTGVQPIFKDKRCAIFTLIVRIKMMQFILSMQTEHSVPDDKTLQEFFSSWHQSLNGPIVQNHEQLERWEKEKAAEQAEDMSLGDLLEDDDFEECLNRALREARQPHAAAAAAGERTKSFAELISFFENYADFCRESEEFKRAQRQCSPKKIDKSKSSIFGRLSDHDLVLIPGSQNIKRAYNYSDEFKKITEIHFRAPRIGKVKDDDFEVLHLSDDPHAGKKVLGSPFSTFD